MVTCPINRVPPVHSVSKSISFDVTSRYPLVVALIHVAIQRSVRDVRRLLLSYLRTERATAADELASRSIANGLRREPV